MVAPIRSISVVDWVAIEDVAWLIRARCAWRSTAARLRASPGSPEGELALAQVALYLACAPKSNAAYVAYNAARISSPAIRRDRYRCIYATHPRA